MRCNKPLLLGITGGIASGKTTVSKKFVRLGAVLIDADEISRNAVKPKMPAWKKIVKVFGKNILNSDLSINRKKLGNIIFSNKEKKIKLEQILHPVIKKEIKIKIKDLCKKSQNKIVLLDIPLLYETNMQNFVDKVLVVWTPRRVQVGRLKLRDKFSMQEINIRLKNQFSLAKKKKLADFVIDNSTSKKDLINQIKKLWKVCNTKMIMS